MIPYRKTIAITSAAVVASLMWGFCAILFPRHPALAQVQPGASVIRIASPVLVTTPRLAADQFENTICASSSNPRQLLIGVMQAVNENVTVTTADTPADSDVDYYTSSDEGASWRLALQVRHNLTNDPTCAFGPDGTMYAMAEWPLVAHDASPNRPFPRYIVGSALALFESIDTGKHWIQIDQTIAENNRMSWGFDRPWIAVDQSSARWRGTVYWAVRYTVFIISKTIFGRTWVAPPGGDGEYIGRVAAHGTVIHKSNLMRFYDSVLMTGQLGVLSDGTIVSAMMDSGNGRDVLGLPLPPAGTLWALVSTDGGRTVTRKVIGNRKMLNGDGIHHLPEAHWLPAVAVDRSSGPFRDRVYVAWTEASTGRKQIWVTHSIDVRKGKWASPRVVDDSRPFDPHRLWLGPNNMNQAIAVNDKGVVGLFWGDRRNNPHGGYQPRFMASLDGGRTWSASVPVTKKSVSSPGFTEPGDHWGMTADAAGVFHPVWLAPYQKNNQVFTTSITVEKSGPIANH